MINNKSLRIFLLLKSGTATPKNGGQSGPLETRIWLGSGCGTVGAEWSLLIPEYPGSSLAIGILLKEFLYAVYLL